MVKEFLSQKGVGFREVDVSRDHTAAKELVNKTGQMGVPVTVVDGQVIVGFDRSRLEQTIDQLESTKRPYFGASIADAGKITARQGQALLGALIGKVKPGSVAGRLGLEPGDIITEFNMRPISNANDIEGAISKLKKGSRISLVFIRGNKTLSNEGVFNTEVK
ncbi:glutaredoxin domain-containing protein [Chloroflexota bacterium]